MDLLGWIFFGPAKMIGQLSYAGLLISGALISLQIIRTFRAGDGFDKAWFRKAPVFAGLLWAIFNFYELQLSAVMGSAMPGAPVLLRLDLIVLAPLLYVMTGFALYELAKKQP